MIHHINIPTGFAPAIIRKRELCGKYVTKASLGNGSKNSGYIINREIKLLDTFVCLKAASTSGKIENYTAQLDYLTELCKCSKNTLARRISQLEDMGFIHTHKQGRRIDIYPKAWAKIAAAYKFSTDQKHTIIYDTDKPRQTIAWHLRDVEFEEANNYQQLGFICTIANIPNIEQILTLMELRGANRQQLETDTLYLQQQLLQLQQSMFAKGTDRKNIVFKVNPLIARSAKTIREAHALKSFQGVTYMKRRLAALDIRFFAQLKPTYSHNRSHLHESAYSGVKYSGSSTSSKGYTQWFHPHICTPSKCLHNTMETSNLKTQTQKLYSTLVA